MTRYRRLFYVMSALSLYILAWWAGQGTAIPAAHAASRQQTVPPPALLSLLPNSGYNSSPTAVQIRGSDFISTPVVLLGSTPLVDVTFVNSATLSATVPAGLTPDSYGLTVKNPDQQQTTQPNAFTVKQATVQVASVQPTYGFAGQPAEVLITGVDFAPGAVARLGGGTTDVALATTFLSSSRLHAVVPAILPPGVYDLSVFNPDGNGGQQLAAYTIHNAATDDLLSGGHALWSDPRTVRKGSTALLGLVVERQGGKNPLINVAVDFYQGNPSAGGTKIGTGMIPLLSPRSSASTSSVEWPVTAAQTYTLYALIDPQNKVAESLERNNVVSRTVAALGIAADQTPPQMESIALVGGGSDTTAPSIILDAQASDPLPGWGVRGYYLREFVYHQGSDRWLPTQDSGWLASSNARALLGWSLVPLPGIHILQAWAADAVGNVSAPLRLGVNYVASPDYVEQDQVRLYRYTLKPDQQLHVRVEPSSGDADLYIWPPNHPTQPVWASVKEGLAVDELIVTAPVGGIYQVEVYGYAASDFQIQIDEPAARLAAASLAVTEIPAAKTLREQPLIPANLAPGDQQGLATAPASSDHPLLLPVVRR